MGFWKELVDTVAQKTKGLEEEAKRRAAKKATEMAIDTGKAAAKAAVRNAGKSLDYAGKKLEEAIFGEARRGDGEDERKDEALPFSRPGPSTKEPQKAAPDPFAKLKAEEAARKNRDKEDKAREEARAQTERDVDVELAALRKKIRDA